MALFGKGYRYTVIATGQFNCPHCGVPRVYEHKEVHESVFFFGMPVGQQERQDDLVECTYCGYGYNTDVLKFRPSKPQPGVARIMGAVKDKLDKGFPAEYIYRDLLNNGVDPTTAQSAIDLVMNDQK